MSAYRNAVSENIARQIAALDAEREAAKRDATHRVVYLFNNLVYFYGSLSECERFVKGYAYRLRIEPNAS